MLSYSLPLLLSSLIGYGASYTDRFVVAGLLNTSLLGIYNFSLLIAGALPYLTAPFNNILLSKFSAMFSLKDLSGIRNSIRFVTLVLSSFYVPIAIFISYFSSAIITHVARPEYISGAIPLSIIMVVSAVLVPRSTFQRALMAVRKTFISVYSSGTAITLNIILSIILIPRFGLIGASIGYSSVFFGNFIVFSYFANKNGFLDIEIKSIIKIWISSGIMLLSFLVLSPLINWAFPLFYIRILIYLLIGITVYIVSIKILKVFSQSNKNLVISLFPETSNRIRKILTLLL